MDGNADVIIGAYAWANCPPAKIRRPAHREIAGVPVPFDQLFHDHENSFPQELLDKLVKRANLAGLSSATATFRYGHSDQLGEEHMKPASRFLHLR